MVTVKLAKSGLLELEDKKSKVILNGSSLTLNDQTYNSPGEYEAGGVEIIYGTSAALIVWERLQIAYVFHITQPTDFEIGQFSSSDVVIFSQEEKITKKEGTTILDEYDPKILIVTTKTEFEEGVKEGLKFQETTALKLSVTSLPEEGRDSFVLA